MKRYELLRYGMRRNRLWEPNAAGRKTLSLGWEEEGKGGEWETASPALHIGGPLICRLIKRLGAGSAFCCASPACIPGSDPRHP